MAELEIRHVSKSFGGKKILDDVTLSIEKGDIFGILGPSGAGKSTLVRCINGLETVDSGEITYQGRKLLDNNVRIARSDRMRLAMIFQNFNLLEQKNALKNVELSLIVRGVPRKERKERALKYLERVGLAEKWNFYPSQLSGGQQQRVAIARALALEPDVILSDEATSALDEKTTEEILSLLSSLNKELGLTVIMISHQLPVIERICNKVAIIDGSRIAESGTVSEVFLHPKSQIARSLAYSGQVDLSFVGEKLLRLVFDGNVEEPIISEIVSECGIPVSLVYASSKTVEGKMYGQSVIKQPERESDTKKLVGFLHSKGVETEEVRL